MKNGENPYVDILKRHKLKVTQPRLQVLDFIDNKGLAVSQPELEKLLGNSVDRVTLYRTLAVFEEKGILHKIFDLNGTATYAICSVECTEHNHVDQHVHFICSNCNDVHCLDNISLPPIQTPSGFKLQNMAVNAIGLCDKCSN